MLSTATTLAPMAAAQDVLAGGGWEVTLDIAFPTVPQARFSNDYDGARGGGTRVHKSTDVMGQKHWPLYAVVQGTVCYMTGLDGVEPSWGYHLTICGDDGREYDYLHINNDTPGTDDGLGGVVHAYAPGMRRGLRVARGQFVAYMGDSGNAEETAPHLHFEIHDDTVLDPYGDTRINPFFSLTAAVARGDYPDGAAVLTDPISRIAGADRVGTATELTAETFRSADHVVLAPSTSPAPAIVGGPLAAALGGPVLTTAPGALDQRVIDAVAELGATRVTVVGDVGLDPATLGAAFGLDEADIDVIDGGDDLTTAELVAYRVWEELGVTTPDDGGPAEPEAPAADYVGSALPWVGDVTEVDEAWLDVRDGVLDPGDLEPTLAAAVAALDGPVLVVTDDRRSDGVLLDGATVTTSALTAQLLGADPRDIAYVDFFLDDSEFDRRRFRRERHHPYDAGGSGDGGPGAIDLSWYRSGSHVLSARVTHHDGSMEEVHAVFSYDGRDGAGGVGGVEPPAKAAIIALGRHADPDRAWPDSLVASWYGAVRAMPILLTEGDVLSESTARALDGMDEVLVFGGTSAIAEAVVEQAAALAGVQPLRLSGPSRYDTALAVAQDLVDRRLVGIERVWAATGRNWPDATTAGAAVAEQGGVLVLVDGMAQGGDAATQAWLSRHAEEIDQATALGGTAAVNGDALDRLARVIT